RTGDRQPGTCHPVSVMRPDHRSRIADHAPALRALAACALACLLTHAAAAQTYPSRPVRLVAPFPRGSSADFTSRLFAPGLSELLGQQFVVDNRTGAAGNIGAELVARAAPDGYTLLTCPSSVAASTSLYRKRSFDLTRDFEAVSLLT